MSDEEGSEAGDVDIEASGDETDFNNQPKEDEDENRHQMSYASYQMFVFLTCYITYSIMLYNRKAFSFTLPHVIVEEYFSSYEIGMILGAQTVSYTFSKFFFSWATDVFPPRLLLVAGLFLTGFVTLAFSDQEDWNNIMVLCAANGLFQGVAWPAVTKMIRSWFPRDENLPINFGLWYALLSTAANVVGAFGPGLANSLAVHYGWRLGIQIPAIIALIASGLSYFCLWDKPANAGYEVEVSSGKKHHWSDLAGNTFMMLLAINYFTLFVVKTCCQDWGQLYLLDERGVPPAIVESYMTSFEIGGLVGSIILGALTDFIIRKEYYKDAKSSPRMIMVQICVAGSAMFLNLFIFIMDQYSTKATMAVVGFFMGVFMYGSISLIGTIAVETAPITMSGSALAAVGLAGNFGGIAAGGPVEQIAVIYDWFTAFMGVNFLCVITFMILIAGKDIPASFGKGKGGKRIKLA